MSLRFLFSTALCFVIAYSSHAAERSEDVRLVPESASDGLGSVAQLDGDTLVVNGRSGREVFVFVRDEFGGWSQQAVLIGPDWGSSQFARNSLAVSGDIVVIGAPDEDAAQPGQSGTEGAVYVFVRDSQGNWSRETRLTASDGADRSFFGKSVDIQDDTLVVGSSNDSGTGSSTS